MIPTIICENGAQPWNKMETTRRGALVILKQPDTIPPSPEGHCIRGFVAWLGYTVGGSAEDGTPLVGIGDNYGRLVEGTPTAEELMPMTAETARRAFETHIDDSLDGALSVEIEGVKPQKWREPIKAYEGTGSPLRNLAECYGFAEYQAKK